MVQNTIIQSELTRRASAALPGHVLTELARHARAAGLCLVVLGSDGAVAHADVSAGAFYERFVVPALRHEALRPAIRKLTDVFATLATPQPWELIPGVTLCAVPVIERRQLVSTILLCSRAEYFNLTEDVLRFCSQLSVDAQWLEGQVNRTASVTGAQAEACGAIFLSMLRDKLRVDALEGELNTLSTQLANAYEELSLIEQVSSGMRVNRRSLDFFRHACIQVMQVLGVRAMGAALWHDKCRQEPTVYGETTLTPEALKRLEDELTAILALRKSVLIVNDVPGSAVFGGWLGKHAQRLIAVPLQRGEQVLGCVFGFDKAAGDFDSVDSKLLASIANESAIYLENAILYGDVHALMMGLLHSLTSAVDAKDAYTCGHSERVALLSRHLAACLGLSDSEVERIYMAGLLHDVGKIGVPESVLQKTGRLTSEEFELMKKHPQIGARILNDVKQLEDIIPGVLYHHERYDGKGYPAGLAGQNIPLMGRIICLADCFDAMTSNRTYRKALPLEVALTEIRRCAGTQFDPALAETFLRITPDQFRSLLRDHQQQAKKLLDLQQNLRAA
jgi:HD-GYP domain-containing protein (c-di-GMP phosphodiesterase class II)